MASNGCRSNGPHPPNPPSVRTHLRDVLGDQTFESLARKGETMSTTGATKFSDNPHGGVGISHGAQRSHARTVRVRNLRGDRQDGYLGAASREFGLTQQAVSARIASIEAQTGVGLV